MQKNCGDKACFEAKKTKAGKHHFVLKARNHQVIGQSQSYSSEAACANGIKSIARAAKGAKIDDQT